MLSFPYKQNLPHRSKAGPASEHMLKGDASLCVWTKKLSNWGTMRELVLP